ncbi:class A beta-lactamase [Streptantibioticus silvisoli]|uniref:Class A beta-lactamase n=1 Tax=Streptantibioticus silvisoli TaxID=2705255 RepID=A0ABT6VY09_9ACTN|nr:class A beta-lactamase [Streptantibioticus silvisoli]MDI5963375.1 class A beta-lactamase [Streptantibioticus silvisoli]
MERAHHARLGLFALDTGTGRTLTYRPDERFAHCSVFKALEGAVLLRRESDAQLDHVVRYRAADLAAYSPITGKHTGTGMTERQLIAAAMDYSDNTAANLLLDHLGGPHGLESDLRALGDETTHNDRPEPEVNEATPGDLRDTSTPRALGTDLRRFALGGTLPRQRREEYTGLLKKNTTGGPFIRAGVPKGWTVGDKTGNGGYGTRNDIAVLWPTRGAPIVLAVMSDRGTQNARSDDSLIADATRIALKALHR